MIVNSSDLPVLTKAGTKVAEITTVKLLDKPKCEAKIPERRVTQPSQTLCCVVNNDSKSFFE